MKATFRMLKQVALLGIFLLLWSCGKDSDPTPTASDLIVGKWKFTSVNFTIKVGNLSLVDYFISQGLTPAEAQELAALFTDEFSSVQVDATVDIKKGGTYTSVSDGVTENGTWELSADGKTLTLDKGTIDQMAFTVSTLTAASMNLTGDQSETDSGVTVTIHFELTLTKL